MWSLQNLIRSLATESIEQNLIFKLQIFISIIWADPCDLDGIGYIKLSQLDAARHHLLYMLVLGHIPSARNIRTRASFENPRIRIQPLTLSGRRFFRYCKDRGVDSKPPVIHLKIGR